MEQTDMACPPTLISAALEIQRMAYAPYSEFMVGAALLVPSGAIYAGCNVENASYGLAICAERAAVAAMVSGGDRQIAGAAVCSVGAVTPCGACRQVLSEFGGDFPIWLLDSRTGQVVARWTMENLLPGAFEFKR